MNILLILSSTLFIAITVVSGDDDDFYSRNSIQGVLSSSTASSVMLKPVQPPPPPPSSHSLKSSGGAGGGRDTRNQEPRPPNPRAPECGGYFPGTPAWNNCFRKFTQDMQKFQGDIHEYAKKQNGGQLGSSYYSSSSSSSSQSTSNIAGYTIQTTNLPISTSIANNMLKITFPSFTDKLETKRTHPNELFLSLQSKSGEPKWARITIPEDVSMNDIIVDRTPDAIYITAPARNSNWNYQSGSSLSSFSNGFMNNGGFQPQPPVFPQVMFPPPPLPQLGNMFGDLFHNVFSMFNPAGVVRNSRQYRYAPNPWDGQAEEQQPAFSFPFFNPFRNFYPHF